MDPDNPVIKLCIEGAQAEFAGSVEEADKLYRQAWTAACDDYERYVAAHYVARCQKTPEERLHWNREALVRAEAVGDEQVRSFYPSLYVNLGYAYEAIGNLAEAKRYYDLAAGLGLVHQDENYSPPAEPRGAA